MDNKFLEFEGKSVYLERYFKVLRHCSSPKRFKYSEGHHVFPKFVFGENKEIRYVSFRAHFILHELLWRHFKKIGNLNLANKAVFPLIRMKGKNISSQNKSNVVFSSRSFEVVKRASTDALTGSGNPMYGKKHTEEAKRSMSTKKKGRPMSEEQKQKMTGRKISEETRMKLKNANRPKVTPEQCLARSERMKQLWAKRKEHRS